MEEDDGGRATTVHRRVKRGSDDDGGTTPLKTVRPSGPRGSMTVLENPSGTSTDLLVSMMKTLHVESTDEKLDGAGRWLVQNERRIAHLEEKMEAQEGIITQHMEQQARHAQERLRQQGERMGAEH